MTESFHGKRLSSLFKVITVFLSIGTKCLCVRVFSVELRVRLQFSSFFLHIFSVYSNYFFKSSIGCLTEYWTVSLAICLCGKRERIVLTVLFIVKKK